MLDVVKVLVKISEILNKKYQRIYLRFFLTPLLGSHNFEIINKTITETS